MDVRKLRYFSAIAECGSLSAAAERLGIAQPSLSFHIQRIEADLGVQLLVRSPRGVILTESGQRLYAHAQTIIQAVEAAVADLRGTAAEPVGPVSFAFPSSASSVLTVPLAETIRHEYPKILLRAMEAMSGHVQAWLMEGSIDFGILYDVSAVRHLKVRPLLIEELYLVAASDNWPGCIGPDGIAQSPITLAECAKLDLILPNRSHGLREMIERFAAAQKAVLDVSLEIDSLSRIKSLVARGSGYTILPHAAISEEIERKTLVPVPIVSPVMRRTVYMVNNPERPLGYAAKEVERVAVEIVEELVRKRIWLGQLVEPA